MRFLLSAVVSLSVPAIVLFAGVVVMEQYAPTAPGKLSGKIPGEWMAWLAVGALACWAVAGAIAYRSRAPFNYTRTIMILAITSACVGALGRFMLGDEQWDKAIAAAILCAMTIGAVTFVIDLVSWRRWCREAGPAAETANHRPSLFRRRSTSELPPQPPADR